jgi:Tfp pilus assembly protein PilX
MSSLLTLWLDRWLIQREEQASMAAAARAMAVKAAEARVREAAGRQAQQHAQDTAAAMAKAAEAGGTRAGFFSSFVETPPAKSVFGGYSWAATANNTTDMHVMTEVSHHPKPKHKP